MKKLFINENKFKSLMTRMDGHYTLTEGKKIHKMLITEATKAKGLLAGMSKYFDNFARSLGKSMDEFTVLKKSVDDMDTNVFKHIDDFTGNFSFLKNIESSYTRVADEVTAAVKKMADDVGELKIAEFAERGAQLPKKDMNAEVFFKYRYMFDEIGGFKTDFKRYDQTLHNLENLVKNVENTTGSVDNTILSTLTGNGKKIESIIEDVDNLNDLEGVMSDTWKSIKKNAGETSFVNSSNKLKAIKNSFSAKGLETSWNPIKIIRGNKNVTDIIDKKGLTGKNSFIIEHTNANGAKELVIIQAKNADDLAHIKTKLKGDPTIKIKEINSNSKTDWTQKYYKGRFIFIYTVVGIGAVWTIFAGIVSWLFCSDEKNVWDPQYSDSVLDKINRLGESEKPNRWLYCFFGDWVENVFSPIVAFAKWSLPNLKHDILGMSYTMEEEVMKKCTNISQTPPEEGEYKPIDTNLITTPDCDCKKVALAMVQDKASEGSIMRSLISIQDEIDKLPPQVQSAAMNRFKNALMAVQEEEEELGNLLLNNISTVPGELFTVENMVQNLCDSLQSKQITIRCQNIIDHWEGEIEWGKSSETPVICDSKKANQLYQDIRYLKKQAKNGNIRLEADGSKWKNITYYQLFPLYELTVDLPENKAGDTGNIELYLDALLTATNAYNNLLKANGVAGCPGYVEPEDNNIEEEEIEVTPDNIWNSINNQYKYNQIKMNCVDIKSIDGGNTQLELEQKGNVLSIMKSVLVDSEGNSLLDEVGISDPNFVSWWEEFLEKQKQRCP
jgi:hypothetical protein